MVNYKPRLKRQTVINEKRFAALMRDIKNDVVRTTTNAKSLDTWVAKLGGYVVQNAFITGPAAGETQSILSDILRATEFSPLPKGGQMEVVKGVISESTMHHVTRMGDDLKNEMRRIAVEAYDAKMAPKELAKELASRIDVLSNSRAQVIARTETMRASNLAGYTNASLNMGANSFIVTGAPDRCELCVEAFDGLVFDISQSDMIPPWHPRCRCTPQYSTKTVEEWADQLGFDIA